MQSSWSSNGHLLKYICANFVPIKFPSPYGNSLLECALNLKLKASIGVWHLGTKAKVKVIICLFLLFSKLFFYNFHPPNIPVPTCAQTYVVPPEMQEAALR